MHGLNRLPGFKRSPPGREWALWKRLPVILALGTAVPIGCAIVIVMKGPAFVADAYPPPGREQTAAGESCSRR